jgi:hypothetical protein
MGATVIKASIRIMIAAAILNVLHLDAGLFAVILELMLLNTIDMIAISISRKAPIQTRSPITKMSSELLAPSIKANGLTISIVPPIANAGRFMTISRIQVISPITKHVRLGPAFSLASAGAAG